MVLEGFFVSPAVMAMDSVPPLSHVRGCATRKDQFSEQTYKAKEAVTKTEANPPMPPTKGASPMFQYLPPMYSWFLLPPQLTTIPRMMKICETQ